MRRITFAVAACGLLFAGAAQSASYVLNASKWGAAQDKAVAQSGGTVKLKHGNAGIALVESDNPNFLAAVSASGVTGALDREVQWIDPVATVALEDAVNPGNDTFYPIQWAPRSIEAPAAWAMGYTGAGVRVAIIDGGLFNAHPDLAANIDTAASRSFVAPNPNDLPGNPCRVVYNCDTGTFWHGTHVAGIVAAIDNSTGVVGIAPGARLIGVKALHNGSGSFGAVISAILYAAGEAHADVINMSLGAVIAKNEEGASELRNAIAKAIKAASETALVVVSAGNDALSLDGNNLVVLPAEAGPAMVVSATGPMGFAYGSTDFSRFASYSNYGHSLVNVAGPGGDFAYPGNENCTMPVTGGSVTTACWVFDMVLSTSRAGYTWAAGTSMSAPAVSAVAALVKQKNPGMSPDKIRKQIEKSSTNVGKNNNEFYGRGYLNAKNAVAD